MKIDESKFRFRIGDKVKYENESYTILGYCFQNEFNNYNDYYGYLIDKVSFRNAQKVFDEEGYAIEYCLDYLAVPEYEVSPMNLCERLKYAPKGSMMYSPCIGPVCLKEVDDEEITVTYSGYEYKFNCHGQIRSTHGLCFGECMLFPSKENRDWNTVDYSKPRRKDLPVGTPVFCFEARNPEYRLILRYYGGDGYAFNDGNKEGKKTHWGHIVPVDKFDFKTLTYKPEDDYGTESEYNR